MVKALLQKKISIKKWQRRIIHMENKLINTGQNSIMDNFIFFYTFLQFAYLRIINKYFKYIVNIN